MTETSATTIETIKSSNEDKHFKLKAAVFLTSVTGFSILAGFGTSLASARKKDPQAFSKGMTPTLEVAETGGSLALRALGWGTLYAVAGTSLLCYGIWKLSGAKDLKEFRIKMGNMLPVVPKNNPPQSRTEFSGLNDFLTYVSTEKFGQGPVKNTESNTESDTN